MLDLSHVGIMAMLRNEPLPVLRINSESLTRFLFLLQPFRVGSVTRGHHGHAAQRVPACAAHQL